MDVRAARIGREKRQINQGNFLYNFKSFMRKIKNHEFYMKKALKVAEKAAVKGHHPFAVVVVNGDGRIIWRDYNKVNKTMDPTAHAEINAIRKLCRKYKTLSLRGFTFYITTEPCPVCFAAINNSQVSVVYFGAPAHHTQFMPISAKELAKHARKYPIKVEGGILEKECLEQRERLWKR